MRLSKKNLQYEFIKELYDYCIQTQNLNLLQQLISTRERIILSQFEGGTIGNLEYLFSTSEAANILGKQPCSSLPKIYFHIEQLAIKFFGCLLKCSTEFEIFKLIHKPNVLLNHDSETVSKNTTSTIIDEKYHYELVPDISEDERFFHTEFSDQPLPLSDAIVLINIATFVKEHKWYEMLNHLDISSKGEHFILYQYTENNLYPTIISSALIQTTSNKHEWLFFDGFFQNTKWKPNLENDGLLSLTKATSMTPLTRSQFIDKTSDEIENDLFYSILDKTKVCEAIRLTISGSKSKANYHLYLAQKGLAMALKESGRDAVFTIIEKPAMVLFYKAMNLLAPTQSPYVFTSEQDVNKTGIITYKGIWLLKNASSAFNQYSFKAYNANIISLRKKLRNQ
ncbi:autoinducer synthase [Aliivibrio fischeri MJ11]|uniref:acyl-homoserine-lactone synthase n=3 Tax=Aliivibrio fischeri TaxID=668 RepID=Q56687_ALIFS|nr:N-3-oxohexanoyl-L-homoserine lactone synthase AinS [Aliivibrio fischeri]AAA81582.1 autoinducer synthase [Aliivibrio fischeri]ACH66680.1 autoinducer synthase [Aliivibrio fischeri MJ11]prf//2201404A autoinducer synthesis protein [Aliivibrio fischeri]